MIYFHKIRSFGMNASGEGYHAVPAVSKLVRVVTQPFIVMLARLTRTCPITPGIRPSWKATARDSTRPNSGCLFMPHFHIYKVRYLMIHIWILNTHNITPYSTLSGVNSYLNHFLIIIPNHILRNIVFSNDFDNWTKWYFYNNPIAIHN